MRHVLVQHDLPILGGDLAEIRGVFEVASTITFDRFTTVADLQVKIRAIAVKYPDSEVAILREATQLGTPLEKPVEAVMAKLLLREIGVFVGGSLPLSLSTTVADRGSAGIVLLRSIDTERYVVSHALAVLVIAIALLGQDAFASLHRYLCGDKPTTFGYVEWLSSSIRYSSEATLLACKKFVGEQTTPAPADLEYIVRDLDTVVGHVSTIPDLPKPRPPNISVLAGYPPAECNSAALDQIIAGYAEQLSLQVEAIASDPDVCRQASGVIRAGGQASVAFVDQKKTELHQSLLSGRLGCESLKEGLRNLRNNVEKELGKAKYREIGGRTLRKTFTALLREPVYGLCRLSLKAKWWKDHRIKLISLSTCGGAVLGLLIALYYSMTWSSAKIGTLIGLGSGLVLFFLVEFVVRWILNRRIRTLEQQIRDECRDGVDRERKVTLGTIDDAVRMQARRIVLLQVHNLIVQMIGRLGVLSDSLKTLDLNTIAKDELKDSARQRIQLEAGKDLRPNVAELVEQTQAQTSAKWLLTSYQYFFQDDYASNIDAELQANKEWSKVFYRREMKIPLRQDAKDVLSTLEAGRLGSAPLWPCGDGTVGDDIHVILIYPGHTAPSVVGVIEKQAHIFCDALIYQVFFRVN